MTETKKMNLFDIVNDISYKKEYVFDEDIYNAYITNLAFSMYMDTIFIANEANKLTNLDAKLQHDYLFNIVYAKKRWAKWPKKVFNEDLSCIMEYYKYSIDKAKSVISLLSDDQLAQIKQELTQDGMKYEKYS